MSTDFEGIYTIDEWTANNGACDAPGNSVLELQPEHQLYVQPQEFFGVDYLAALTCADDADCRADAADEPFPLFGGFAFDAGDDDAGWTGSASSYALDDTTSMCVGQTTLSVMTGTATSISIRSETFDISYPPQVTGDDPDGCDYADFVEETEGEPCINLEIIVATRSGEL